MKIFVLIIFIIFNPVTVISCPSSTTARTRSQIRSNLIKYRRGEITTQCAELHAECNPYLDEPCCKTKHTCISLVWNKSEEIFNCVKGGVIGKLCNVNSDCEVKDEKYEELGLNAMVECSSQKLCTCKKGFVSENFMVCRAYLNSFCIMDVNCVTTNAICNTDTNKCKCRQGYKAHGNNKCARKSNYGFY